MQDKTEWAFAIIGFIVIVIIIFGVVYGLRAKEKLEKKNEVEKEEKRYQKDMVIRATYNNIILNNIVYKLYNEKKLLQQGILLEGSEEVIKGLYNDTNYTIIIEDKDYYKQEINCNPDNYNCISRLDKHAKIKPYIVKITEDYFRILIYTEDGIVKNPALCFSEDDERTAGFQLYENNTRLTKGIILDRFKLYLDNCFPLLESSMIEGLHELDLYLITGNGQLNKDSTIRIIVIDQYPENNDIDIPDAETKLNIYI